MSDQEIARLFRQFYTSLPVQELRSIARDNKIRLAKGMKKDQIVRAIVYV